MELTGPVWEMLGSKANDVIAMKRWLAFLEGGLLPVISLTSLHFFTKYDDGKSTNGEVKEVIKEVIVEKEVIKEVIVEKEVIKEVIVEVPVIEEVIIEKIVEVPVEVVVEKYIELPQFQSESVEEEDYFDESLETDDFEYIIKEETTNDNVVDEIAKPNRLSYIKTQS
jgi:hypothetical protein